MEQVTVIRNANHALRCCGTLRCPLCTSPVYCVSLQDARWSVLITVIAHEAEGVYMSGPCLLFIIHHLTRGRDRQPCPFGARQGSDRYTEQHTAANRLVKTSAAGCQFGSVCLPPERQLAPCWPRLPGDRRACWGWLAMAALGCCDRPAVACQTASGKTSPAAARSG